MALILGAEGLSVGHAFVSKDQLEHDGSEPAMADAWDAGAHAHNEASAGSLRSVFVLTQHVRPGHVWRFNVAGLLFEVRSRLGCIITYHIGDARQTC